MTEMKFFVYGSLAEGCVHFEKIKNFIHDSVPAKFSGSVYRLKVGYPVVLEDGSDSIPGYLMTLRGSELLFNLLDEFHGFKIQDPKQSLFFRKESSVWIDDGRTELAWIYVLNPAQLPATSKRIEGGDWKTDLALNEPLIEKLTERQKTYIQKLGRSSGREIIPIDLALYRELMNLEMIVDKGRRIALSKVGHEAYRYLT